MILEQLQNPFFIVLLLVFISVFLFVIKNEEYIPGSIFFIFGSLGAVLQITNLGQISLLKAILLFFLVSILSYKNLKKGSRKKYGGIFLLLLYFLSVFVSGTSNNISFVDYRSEIGLLVMAIVISMSPNKVETIRFLTITIMFWGLINAFIVISAKLGLGWGHLVLFNEGGRAIGLTRHSTFMGAYFSIALIAAQILYLQASLKVTKLLLFAFGLLIMLGLLATLARGAFIGWLAGFLFIQYRMQGTRIGSIIGLLVTILIGIVIASSLGLDQLLIDRFTGMDKDSSAQARIPLILLSLEVFFKHPFLGTGVGWLDAGMHLESHNMFMQVLVEGGVVGFLLFVTILWKAGWGLLNNSNTKVVSKVKSVATIYEKKQLLYGGVINASGIAGKPQKKKISQKVGVDSIPYYTGLVAMLGAILLNSLTHSFDFFMPLWILIGVGLMKKNK